MKRYKEEERSKERKEGRKEEKEDEERNGGVKKGRERGVVNKKLARMAKHRYTDEGVKT